MKIYGIDKPTTKEARKFLFVIKTKDPVFLGDYDYNRAKTRLQRVPSALIKYYGVCVYETKDEAYRHFYKCLNMNRYKMELWAVQKITVGKLYNFLNRPGI